jgi:hypothetical protein
MINFLTVVPKVLIVALCLRSLTLPQGYVVVGNVYAQPMAIITVGITVQLVSFAHDIIRSITISAPQPIFGCSAFCILQLEGIIKIQNCA